LKWLLLLLLLLLLMMMMMILLLLRLLKARCAGARRLLSTPLRLPPGLLLLLGWELRLWLR